VIDDEQWKAFVDGLAHSPLRARMDRAHAQVKALEEGHGLAFRNVTLADDREMAGPVTPDELRTLNYAVKCVHIISVAKRPGAARFLHDLEFDLFDPGSTVNRDILLHLVKWETLLWWIATIPSWRLGAVGNIAKRHGFRLAPTVPVVVSGPARVVIASLTARRRDEPGWEGVAWFPVDQDTRTLEVIPPSPGQPVLGIFIDPQ
jgi:hypothetical protein